MTEKAYETAAKMARKIVEDNGGKMTFYEYDLKTKHLFWPHLTFAGWGCSDLMQINNTTLSAIEAVNRGFLKYVDGEDAYEIT